MNKIIIAVFALLCFAAFASASGCAAADSKQCQDLYGLCIATNIVSNYCVSCIPDYSKCLYAAGCQSYDPFTQTCANDLKCQNCQIASAFTTAPVTFAMVALSVIAMLF